MAALALVVLWATPGWVLFPGSSNSDLVGEYNSIEELLGMTKSGTPTAFRWTQPSDINSAAGIGSGIAYAYDPRFCDDILLRFDERASAWLRFWEFVTCESVKQSVLLAFDTWAANHPHLHFLDVSDECTSKDLWKTVEKDACTSTNCARCSIAEIVISTFTKNDENDHSGARIVPVDVTSTDPRGTNGLTQDGGKFEYVELQYANDLCWYLDQTFCAIFFDAQIAGVDVETLMLSLFITIELIACFVTLVFVLIIARTFFHTLLDTWDTDGDGSIEAHEILGAGRAAWGALFEWISTGSLAKASAKMEGRKIHAVDANLAAVYTLSKLNILIASFVLSLVAFPPVFMLSVFNPCWNCQDFKAASVHEIGHILGLDHPDQHKDQNFASDREAYNCTNTYSGVSMTSDYDSSSVLRAQLVHDPKTCLTNDDLDGLNFLYPVCSNRVETPQCIEQQLNLGYLRLSLSILAAVFIPIIFVVALKIYAAIMLRCSKRLREKGLELKARKAEIQKVQQKTREAKSVAKREERQKSASTAGGAGGSRGGLGRMMSRGSSSGGSGGGVGRYMSRGSSVRPKVRVSAEDEEQGPEVIAEGAEDAEPEVQPVAAAELGGASVEADHEIHPVRERPDLDDTDRVAPGTTVGR